LDKFGENYKKGIKTIVKMESDTLKILKHKTKLA